ncbi:MAG: hypothetical protein KKG33_11310 [candidate division Zixibacteria bacterium]|nr:hypothetical protein [candidate division Zixibacteria bacterium]
MRTTASKISNDNMSAATLRLCLACLAIVLALGISDVNAGQMQYTSEFSQSDFQLDEANGFDIVRMRQCDYLTNLGQPWLPCKVLRIALPPGLNVQSLRVVSSDEVVLPGTYSIFPAQPPLRISESTDDAVFIEPDVSVYASSDRYPSEMARFVSQSDVAGQAFATVKICPLQYVPSEKKLILQTSVTFILEGTDDYVCGDYLSPAASQKSRLVYERLLSEIASNPEDANPIVATPDKMSTTMLPTGPFDHVIIANSTDAPYYSDLVDWHNKKGVRDTVVTTTYIYGTYSGSNNQEKIRNFVIDAHDNWGTIYFLIGGEHGDVPFKSKIYEGETIPSDHYYADYDDDWDVEVFVGRVTADDPTQIQRFIDKVLKYEIDPELSNYILDATILGMDLTIATDPPYYTLTAGEELKELIDTAYIPSNFDVIKIYDSQSSNHLSDLISAMNDGQNLFNHCDHSNYSVMGTGDRNHGQYISSNNVDAFTNTGRMSVIFSIGCHANEMDYNDCIAEHFVIYNDLKGGVAFTGNTRSGWFYVGDPLSLSSAMDIYWWEALFSGSMYRLGDAMAYAKNSCPGSGIWQYCQYTLSLLGEPEMPVWTDSPDSFTVSYPPLLPTGSSQFAVHVDEFGGGVVEAAYVCLWIDGEVFETGYTNSLGNVTLIPAPESLGEMHVTVTKHNFLPYQNTAEVTDVNLPPLCQCPGDTSIFLCDLAEVCFPVGCYDPNGNLQSGPTLLSGPGEIANGEWCYMPSGSETVALTIECIDSEGLECQSTFDVMIRVNVAPTCIPPADTTYVQCVPAMVSRMVSVFDPDGNIVGCEVISGPGAMVHGAWKYTPPMGVDTADVTVRCTDECGEFCETSFQVIFDINYAPVCVQPTDTTVVHCGAPSAISLPVVSFDPDGGTPDCEITVGPGSIVDGYWQYTPSMSEIVYVTIACTDDCGAFCENTFTVGFDLNDPPVCSDERDTTVLACSEDQMDIQLATVDPNDNIVDWEILEGPGSVADGYWQYAPSIGDTVDVTVRCTDDCGEYCDESFRAIFEFNSPPVCGSRGDTTVSMVSLETIFVPVSATDPDGNLAGCSVTEGPGEVVDGNWQYTPTGPDTLDITVTFVDECAATCDLQFTVTVLMFDCGDVTSDGATDIDDVVYLIAYIFTGGPAPDPVEAGDVDCSGAVDIDDAVYLIAFIFSGGPAPCEGCQ